MSDIWSWLKKADNLKAVGAIGGAVATGYGAYKQSQFAKSQLDFQKKVYNRGIQKEDDAQMSFSNAVNNSLVDPNKKKKPLVDLGA